MNDSIYAFSIGETEVSKNLYKEMWKWLKKLKW
jgi:hypothetical protein